MSENNTIEELEDLSPDELGAILINKIAEYNWDPDYLSTMAYYGANLDYIYCDAFQGYTLLHLACTNKNIEIINLLINLGADINITDVMENETPLFSSIRFNNPIVAKILIKAGADVNIKTIDGDTAIRCAIQQNMIDVVDLLIQHGAEYETGFSRPLSCATLHGHIEIVKLLIKAGADINATDHDGWAPIHYASTMGQLDMLKYLLSIGVDINAKRESNEQNTPLHFAAAFGSRDMIKFLLKRGASRDVLNLNGKTPWDLAEPQIKEFCPELNPNA